MASQYLRQISRENGSRHNLIVSGGHCISLQFRLDV